MANDSTEEEGLAKESPETEHHIYEDVKWFNKAEQNQRMAVEELISTETGYVHNLQLCISDIHDHLQKKQLPEIDLEGLFSNIEDVLRVSRHFLTGLETVANLEHEQLFHISTLFQELKEEMENVYKVYCANYDQALILLEIYRKEPRLQKELLDTLQVTVPHTGASDLSFFLVMPVQRVTKYPLLLQKILENTLESDSAYEALSAATKAMIEVNANINEYKRRKEVADKYNKAGYLTLRERLARLNTHSITKKTTRLSRLFMHEAGIVSKTEDKEFDDLEEKFQWLASGVADLKENVASFLSNTEVFLGSQLQENELDIEAGTRQQCCRLAGKLNSIILPEFKKRLERLVYLPLCNLSETLKGPQKLIRKRLDKLLDYEEVEEKRNETGSVTYEEEASMNTYLAINSLLVSELPAFNLVALKWLGQILRSFVALQKDLAKQVLQEAEGEMAQLPHRHLPETDFWKMVEDTLSRAEDQLHSFCKKFESVRPSPVVQPLSPAEERRVLLLVNKHGPDKLFQVTSNISGSKDMDLTLQRGQIVALLHDMDTKGNSNRWLVDAGGPRGYIPSGKVQPYHLVQNQKSKTEMLIPNDGAERRRHSYNLPETASPPVSFITPAFQVVAGYAFTARSSHEVSLRAGQPVTVLEPHDKKGSKEWSLVEVNGQRGYVPSSYLVMAPTPEPPGWSSPVWPLPNQQT
ncbi:rho guanine nucleotide exchange factor 37 [Eublepharis macularius]|uniref:Rho guanine nucleotide exchange factor 37 n=1 Tax=Eublepharis macularius TaxID=481883 RepID=A0AA97KWY4_EUBMA|nr:rho guanine nucleotide exchange factor 37 [Eublepharis macularius]XP_054833717.1 rho guanine nucleotide exchange factor 37 [Eublepharis macularius]